MISEKSDSTRSEISGSDKWSEDDTMDEDYDENDENNDDNNETNDDGYDDNSHGSNNDSINESGLKVPQVIKFKRRKILKINWNSYL